MIATLEQIKPETVRKIATRAQARGLSIDDYIEKLLQFESAIELEKVELTPQEKARLWVEWVQKNSVSVSRFVDDSRDSIYTREDEAL